LLINRATRRCVDLSYGENDCILFAFDRPSDPEYRFVCSHVDEVVARRWLAGEELWDLQATRPARRQLVLACDVEAVALMAADAGLGEVATFLREAWAAR
jgi:hypothetical protein